MKTQAIRIYKYGGPEVLQYEEIELAEPGLGEARVRHTAIGLNFIDTYHRTGLYPQELPTGLGTEAAGIIEAVGPASPRSDQAIGLSTWTSSLMPIPGIAIFLPANLCLFRTACRMRRLQPFYSRG